MQSMRELPSHNRRVCSNDFAQSLQPRHSTDVSIDVGARQVCRERYTNGGFTWPSNNLNDTYPLVLTGLSELGRIQPIRARV